MPPINRSPDELPDGWQIGPNHETHVALVRESNARFSLSAHPMPNYTNESGWVIYARPGTGQIVGEGIPLKEALDEMLEAAAHWNTHEDYPLAEITSLRDAYAADDHKTDQPQSSKRNTAETEESRNGEPDNTAEQTQPTLSDFS